MKPTVVRGSRRAASAKHSSGTAVIGPAMTSQNADNAGQADSLMKESGQLVKEANDAMTGLTGSMGEISAASEKLLHEAQAASVRAATVGTPAEEVDRAGREKIALAGFGSYFIHRTGHGIGAEAHEDPYTVEGKGGLVREVLIPRELAERLEARRLEAPQRITDRGIHYTPHYDLGAGKAWSQSFTTASERALGWSTGAHGLRHSYVQERMNELQERSMTYRAALSTVSQELGHFREDITEVYLR